MSIKNAKVKKYSQGSNSRLYGQTVVTEEIFSLQKVRSLPTRDRMNDEEFNAMMKKGYEQANSQNSLPIDEAFNKIGQNIKSFCANK